jgi:molecular chaperone DnaK (HSP70)
MAEPNFSIGIDLGTTNCAMAFCRLGQTGARSEVFAIPQWESLERLGEPTTLASFLYFPTPQEAGILCGTSEAMSAKWIPGRLARRRAGETPGRVAHSAKSWLGHHAVDRSAPFLPWGSEEIPASEKISPIHASALLLNYLRGAWDSRFGARGAAWCFDAQQITITVPASFDAVAQRLTLDAAAAAGFPPTVRLLEEPQAAFYHWLESHDDPAALWSQLSAGDLHRHHVLVVDVGGGTSDFSLFEISRQSSGPVPAIRRVAVSDHILLGGDNIDLAIAHLMEPRFVGAGEKLAGSQWEDLVARCRDLKERCLANLGEPSEEFPLTLPGRGSNLFAASQSAKVTRAEINAVLLDGFFPECSADARPQRARSALLEWGLPYAADSAVTRHLADFLRELPCVQAILFNGGSLYPAMLRNRIQDLVAQWQGGPAPQILDNPAPDLAVARGAARFGQILAQASERIESGAARSIYLEVHQQAAAGAPTLVCILPRGAASEEVQHIAHLGLELRINRAVRFQCYYSTRHDDDKLGDVVAHRDDSFHKLPALQTLARLAPGIAAPEAKRVPVKLAVRMTEAGLLELECVSTAPGIQQAWPLVFNLRGADEASAIHAAEGTASPGASLAAVAQAQDRMVSLFSTRIDPRDPLSAARLLKSLEAILGMPKADWNLFLIRTLWTTLLRCFPCRINSLEHEEAWLILAGFLLRPGFGAEMDPGRIDDLWQIHRDGLAYPSKQTKLQEFILWRRVAGGLDRERQHEVLAPQLATLKNQKNPPAELVRLAGALERLDLALKGELIALFLDRTKTLADQGGYSAAYLVALGMLLNRTPLYAGPETVVPPDEVAKAFNRFETLDWAAHPGLIELFLRAARVTNNRSLDLPRALRHEIVRRLEKAGTPPIKIIRIERFVPIERSERASLFGESLPPGLTLAGA